MLDFYVYYVVVPLSSVPYYSSINLLFFFFSSIFLFVCLYNYISVKFHGLFFCYIDTKISIMILLYKTA